MNATKLRNGHRVAGSPYVQLTTLVPSAASVPSVAGVRGSCLALWKRADMRDALWSLRGGATRRVAPQRGGDSGAVVVRSVTGADLAEMKADAAASKAAAIAGLKPRREDPLLDAWVGFFQENMPMQSVAFVSATYRDEYGYANGCMLGRNVLKDFQRFLKSQGMEDAPWVCCVETHKERDILHLHALVGHLGTAALRHGFEGAWTHSRGWSRCSPLLDGGVRYCGKYALKAHEAAMFDWSWAS